MRIRPFIPMLLVVVTLVVSVEAGSKKVPAKTPQEPIDKLLATIRHSDPKGLIVAELRPYPAGGFPRDLQVVVTNNFFEGTYQQRYQLTQLWTAGWNKENGGEYSRVFVTDRLGNLVARGTPHLTWVQQP